MLLQASKRLTIGPIAACFDALIEPIRIAES